MNIKKIKKKLVLSPLVFDMEKYFGILIIFSKNHNGGAKKN